MISNYIQSTIDSALSLAKKEGFSDLKSWVEYLEEEERCAATSVFKHEEEENANKNNRTIFE